MPSKKIKIELIHDIICSWCPIGYNNIKAALARHDDVLDPEFRFLPYELNPDMPAQGERIEVHLKRRNNWSNQQLLRYRKDLVETAYRAGLTYDFARRTDYWNTSRAHVLMHIAEKHGMQQLTNETLIQQYFTEGLNVSDPDCLLEVAADVGIDREELAAAFVSPEIGEEMAAKHERVKGFDVRSVPTFVFNDTDTVPGSNSVEFFDQYLVSYLGKTAA